MLNSTDANERKKSVRNFPQNGKRKTETERNWKNR